MLKPHTQIDCRADAVYRLAVSPCGSRIATCDEGINIYDVQGNRHIGQQPAPDCAPNFLTFSPDGKLWCRCLAVAQLTDRRIKALEQTEDGRAALDRFRQQAAEEIETTESWVNLDHAVAISEIPDTLPPSKWSVNTSLSANE